MKKISIVSSCYNEAENVEELYRSIRKETDLLGEFEWEFVFADNCSPDGTADVLKKLAAEDHRVKVIVNQANYGPDRSGANALFSASGDAIIAMASDLEDPPSMIPLFVEAWKEGYPVALGQYRSRKGNPITLLFRKAYYALVNLFSEYKLERNVTGFGIYDASVMNQIKELGEYNIILRFLCTELGYRIKYIPFDKPKRKKGKSSYSFLKYYRYAIETLVQTSHIPLHLASFLGFLMSFGSIIVALVYLILKFCNWYTFGFGLAPVMIGLFFLGGVNLFFIGVIGEYLSSAIKRVTKRPFVIEKERINFDDGEKDEKED